MLDDLAPADLTIASQPADRGTVPETTLLEFAGGRIIRGRRDKGLLPGEAEARRAFYERNSRQLAQYQAILGVTPGNRLRPGQRRER